MIECTTKKPFTHFTTFRRNGFIFSQSIFNDRRYIAAEWVVNLSFSIHRVKEHPLSIRWYSTTSYQTKNIIFHYVTRVYVLLKLPLKLQPIVYIQCFVCCDFLKLKNIKRKFYVSFRKNIPNPMSDNLAQFQHLTNRFLHAMLIRKVKFNLIIIQTRTIVVMVVFLRFASIKRYGCHST